MDKMDNNENLDNVEYITTGQAASLCSVTRNTVFKWIQSGHLTARRTAGGHHRINRRDLENLISDSGKTLTHNNQKQKKSEYRYCWEFNGNGNIQDACLNCAVYELRALRCYEVAKLGPDVHHPKVYCTQNCNECSYFREMHGKRANVLVVTNDRELSNNLMAHAEEAIFNLEITDCEYNCAAIIDNFKPDFVIIDSSLGTKFSQQMSNHIMKDPRIPYVRVIIAGRSNDFPHECDREIFARMTRPFDILSITECINLIEDQSKIKSAPFPGMSDGGKMGGGAETS
jgi:excisionase family DNA binding protein